MLDTFVPTDLILINSQFIIYGSENNIYTLENQGEDGNSPEAPKLPSS